NESNEEVNNEYVKKLLLRLISICYSDLKLSSTVGYDHQIAIMLQNNNLFLHKNLFTSYINDSNLDNLIFLKSPFSGQNKNYYLKIRLMYALSIMKQILLYFQFEDRRDTLTSNGIIYYHITKEQKENIRTEKNPYELIGYNFLNTHEYHTLIPVGYIDV